MSKIVAAIQGRAQIPAEMYAEIQRLQSRGKIDLIDVTEIAIKDNGKIKFENAMTFPLLGSAPGHFLSAFVGLIFFHPHYMVNDRVQKVLQEISLDQNFISTLTSEALSRNSVLFLYLRNQNTSPLVSAMTQYGGRVVEMSLLGGQEEKLKRLFRGKSLPDPEYHLNL